MTKKLFYIISTFLFNLPAKYFPYRLHKYVFFLYWLQDDISFETRLKECGTNPAPFWFYIRFDKSCCKGKMHILAAKFLNSKFRIARQVRNLLEIS